MSVSTPSTACWSSDARITSAPLDPGRGRGQCASDPDPCNTVIGAVFLRFGFVAAHDIAAPCPDDLFHEELRLAPLAFDQKRDEGLRVIKDDLAHELVGSLPGTKNVVQSARLERRDGCGADKAPIRHDADPAHAKARPQ